MAVPPAVRGRRATTSRSDPAPAEAPGSGELNPSRVVDTVSGVNWAARRHFGVEDVALYLVKCYGVFSRVVSRVLVLSRDPSRARRQRVFGCTPETDYPPSTLLRSGSQSRGLGFGWRRARDGMQAGDSRARLRALGVDRGQTGKTDLGQRQGYGGI
jgi:hypothetical protein